MCGVGGSGEGGGGEEGELNPSLPHWRRTPLPLG